MSKKNKKEDVTVTALGPEKSQLAKSSAFEAKISKADMTNIIKQNILEKLNQELINAQKDVEFINKEHNNYIEQTIRPKMLKAYVKYITDTYKFEPDVSSISLDITVNSNEIKVKAEYKVVSTNNGRDILDIVKDAKTFRHNYSDEPRMYISLPSISFEDTYIEKNREKVGDAIRVVNDIHSKILKYTDSSYLKAQLDMSIIASTDKGEEVVTNIQKLANSVIKQTGLIPLN